MQCPPPSLPFKCLCLGDGVREDGERMRRRGNITGDACSCKEEEDKVMEEVTRVVCCHTHAAAGEGNGRVIKVL